jgi:histone deacetylase complex subunit SAP18
VPSNELQIYTWLDATLREITNLITEVNPEAKRKGTYFNFCVSFPNPNGPGCRMREIGSTIAGKRGPDDKATLLSKRFVVGDYLDVAITYARNGALEHRQTGGPNRRMRPY